MQNKSASMKKISVETFIQMIMVMAIKRMDVSPNMRNLRFCTIWQYKKKIEKITIPTKPHSAMKLQYPMSLPVSNTPNTPRPIIQERVSVGHTHIVSKISVELVVNSPVSTQLKNASKPKRR